MKSEDIMKAMNGVEERHISEYGGVQPKKRIRVSRRVKIGAAIAAAAALLTLPAGAYVYELTHKAEVQLYLDGESADYIEQHGLVLDHTSENEHIRLTVDTLLSDGHIGEMIMTLEGLDEQGLEAVGKLRIPEIYLTDVETGEYIKWGGYRTDIVCGGTGRFEAVSDNRWTVVAELRLDGIDADRSYLLKFGMGEDGCEYDEDYIIIDNIMEGIALETSFEPNVECEELAGENGGTVWLSQIGIFSDDEDFAKKSYYSDGSLTLLKESGLIRRENRRLPGVIEIDPDLKPVYCGWYREIIDIGDYEGIELDGERYLKIE